MAQQQLSCDNEGVCMACKTQTAEEEKLRCITCATPWHVMCLSTRYRPPTLATTNPMGLS